MRKSILAPFWITATFFVALLVCDSAFAGIQKMPKGDFRNLVETKSGRVVEIIDPLTLRLDNGLLVSLTGLDYPDLDYYTPGNFSIMTVKILKDFLLNQEVILYQTKQDGLGRINRMGHAYAHVVRKSDDGWVQGLMLSLGLARVRTTRYNPEMATQMYELEDAARDSKNGTWAVKGYQVLNADETQGYAGNFEIVEGQVVAVSMQNNRLFLNFGKDWHNDFTVSISAANRRIFANAGLDPQGWSGKKVRVRGWLETYNGPYIEVDHPQQFELLFLKDHVPEEKNTEATSEEETDDQSDESEKKILLEPKRTVIKRGSALPE